MVGALFRERDKDLIKKKLKANKAEKINIKKSKEKEKVKRGADIIMFSIFLILRMVHKITFSDTISPIIITVQGKGRITLFRFHCEL